MKKSKPAKLLLGVLGLATFASLVGTVSGTLAWYSYSTRATVSYSGTSVNNTVQLQIGIASPKEVLSVDQIRQKLSEDELMSDEDKEKLVHMFEEFWDMVEEPNDLKNIDSNHYYFAPIGSGMNTSFINAYLKSNDYATNYLVPVTSGAYSRGDSFALKNSPTVNNNVSATQASTMYYSTIPFVFRVIRTNTITENDYVGNQELWLTDAEIRASSVDDGNIYKSIRIFVDRGNDYEDDFILNPSATSAGSTVVGGLLDLSRDQYYDYDADDNEVIYGEYESIGGIKSAYAGSNEIDDVNGTGRDECDTFTAKHRPGINYYDNYNNCVFKTAEYECLNTIAPLKDEVSGVLHNRDAQHPSSVCRTGGVSDNYLGRVSFTIYMEGWDHSVIDLELEHMFDLGLTFEINKL